MSLTSSASSKSYTVLRVAFGLTAAVWLVSLHPFLNLFYGSDALCPPEGFALSSVFVAVLWWSALAFSLLVTSGYFYRIASVLLFFGLAFFFRTPCRPDNFGDQIFVSLAFLMMFCPSKKEYEDLWLHRTLRLYAGTLYLVPLLYRLGGVQWWNGTASWTALADPSTSRVWQLLSRNPWAVPKWGFFGITYASLAFEGLFPFLIWVKRLRLPMVLVGIVFHVVMGGVLDLGLFPLQMAVVLIGCLDDETISWASREPGLPRGRPLSPARP